jgi:hypothetical protein
VKRKHTSRADFVLNSHEALVMCAGIIFSLDERSDLLLRRHGQVPVIFGSGAIALGAFWDTRLDTWNKESGILVNWSQDVC